MSYLVVCPLSQVNAIAALHNPSDMISLISADQVVTRPSCVPPERHLRLNFNDISQNIEGFISPALAHIETLINFVKQWERKQPLLIHCWMGVSRSTASAYITANILSGDKNEDEWAQILRRHSPEATPNFLMIALADQLLKRNDRMIDAIDKIGRGQDAFEGKPFSIHFNN